MNAPTEQSQRRALMIAAWIAIGAICWLASSVAMGILFGALFAVTFQPWPIGCARGSGPPSRRRRR